MHSEITDLLQRNGYDFIDRSVLPTEPLSAVSEADLRRQLSQRIRQVSTVVVAATEDAHRKPLVQYEIEESAHQGKRLVAVQPLGFAGKPVPKIVDDHANAIVGFRYEQIVAAIEGADIRNHSSYVIAENDDIHRIAHSTARVASVFLILGVLTNERWLPKAQVFLKDRGYVLHQHTPLPPRNEIIGNMFVWGLIGLIVGIAAGGRWPATLALGAGAMAGAFSMGSGMSVAKRAALDPAWRSVCSCDE
jgi:hypothetical protein